MHFKEGKNKGDESVELGKKRQRTGQKQIFWQKINSKTEGWTVFVRSYCTMAEGNTKTCIFLSCCCSHSTNSGSPHLRNSFYVTSQKSPRCIHWYSLREHASNQKAIRQKAYRRVQTWGAPRWIVCLKFRATNVQERLLPNTFLPSEMLRVPQDTQLRWFQVSSEAQRCLCPVASGEHETQTSLLPWLFHSFSSFHTTSSQ